MQDRLLTRSYGAAQHALWGRSGKVSREDARGLTPRRQRRTQRRRERTALRRDLDNM